MRRISFSKAEYDLLYDRLQPVAELERAPDTPTIDRYAAQYATDMSKALKSIHQDPATEYESRQICESMKHNTVPRYSQVIYHTPLKNMPLLINHEDPLMRAIALWRLEIAR